MYCYVCGKIAAPIAQPFKLRHVLTKEGTKFEMLAPNSTLQQGRYLIIRHLSSGGMGAVYEYNWDLVTARLARPPL